MFAQLGNKSFRSVWKDVNKHYKEIYCNLLKIVNISLVSTASSCENERVFKKMNDIKEKFTNKITPKELYNMIVISRTSFTEQEIVPQSLKIFSEAHNRRGKLREALYKIVESM